MLREIITVAALAACLVAVIPVAACAKSESISPDALLSYGISSDPDPIQVSPEKANPSFTTLTIVVSNNTGKAIFCNEISFTIAAGEGARSLAVNAKGIGALATPSDAWQIEGDGQGIFKATPTKPRYQKIADEGLVFQLKDIRVNKQPGITTLVVTESCSMDTKTFSSKERRLDLTKFPYGFYVKDFAPSKPRVKNGETVTLTWNGSDLAAYTILYDDSSADVSNKRTWTSPKLNHATTFILKSSAQVSGETINSYRSTTVTVADPELNATTLNISGTAKAGKFEGDGAIPKGVIVMWSGKVDDIPAGWTLCDGKNGTPDLRSRFIVGAGQDGGMPAGINSYAPHTSGNPDTLPQVSAGTNPVGNHQHKFPSEYRAIRFVCGGAIIAAKFCYGIDTRKMYGQEQPTQEAGGHAHTVVINFDEANRGENRPRWYALCFIMKL